MNPLARALRHLMPTRSAKTPPIAPAAEHPAAYTPEPQPDPTLCPGYGPLGRYHLVEPNRWDGPIGHWGVFTAKGKCELQPDGTFVHRITHVVHSQTGMMLRNTDRISRLITESAPPAYAEELRKAFMRRRTIGDYTRQCVSRIL